MLATIVGRANGRSMRELTIPLPGKSSRTSTQAISVPMTALTTATAAETHTVTHSAARAAGSVIAATNPDRPSDIDVTVRAARGSRTMTLSHSVTSPTPSEVPGRQRRTRRSSGGTATGAAPDAVCVWGARLSVVGVIAMGLLRRVVVDDRDRAGLLLEQRAVHGLPAAEVVDGPQLLGLGERRGELLRDGGVDWAEAGLRPEPLGLGGEQEVVEGGGRLEVLARADHCGGVLDLERLRRRDVLDRVA